jgi:hypothetical protein
MPHFVKCSHRRQALITLGFAVLVSVLLAGCAIPVTTKAPTGAVPAAGHGTVLVRVSMAGLINMNGFGVLARPVGKDGSIEFNGWNLASEGYWTKTGTQDVKGQLVAAQLPAGNYEFYSFIALNSAGMAMGTTKAVKPFSYPFQVRPGEVSYLGEFQMKFEQNRLPSAGSSSQIPFRVLLRDNRAQDFVAVKKLIPDLQPEQITVRLLERDASKAP